MAYLCSNLSQPIAHMPADEACVAEDSADGAVERATPTGASLQAGCRRVLDDPGLLRVAARLDPGTGSAYALPLCNEGNNNNNNKQPLY